MISKLDARAILGLAAELTGVFLYSTAVTTGCFMVAGLLTALMARYVVWPSQGVGIIVVGLAIVESVALGLILGVKQGLMRAVAHGIRTRRLGSAVVAAVFDQALAIAPGGAFGDRGGRVARGIERLPLAEAEVLLHRAVGAVIGAAAAGGSLRCRIGSWLRRQAVETVAKYTLAKFREVGTTSGGVDLELVRRDIEPRIDDLVVSKLVGPLRLWTAAAMVGMPVAVYVQGMIVAAIMK